MRRRTFLILGDEGIKASETITCDVCLYNKTTNKLLIVEASTFSEILYPSSKYSPVGVVLIPGSHNVYGDGSCAVISLKYMNYTTPDEGSTNSQNIYWGQNGTNISTLTNFDQVCYVGYNGTVNKTVQGVTTYAYLPSDKFNTVRNPYDKDAYYYHKTTSNYYIPSPYNEDDTRNTAYYQTSSPSSSNNALSDFDGIGNTEILCSLATKQSDWKTASSITNSSGNGFSPAACCCWRYHTEGTNQGDWYLPACGELGYIIPKYNKINQAIATLTTAYGSTVGAQLDGTKCYWTSTEISSGYARYVLTDNGSVGNNVKNASDYLVRAFLRVK